MTRILLVGCGKMGGALLGGWLDRGWQASDIVVVDPGLPAADDGVSRIGELSALPPGFVPDVVILAVKPQMMDKVAPAYAGFAGKAVFLSIAAGKTISYFAGHFGADAAIVRAMPNTPAAVRRGMTVLVANQAVPQAGRQVCQDLLGAVGDVAWVEDEALIDAVTALSGSGPAYVFLMVECLAAAGVAAGLDRALAARLARATVSGSGELLARSTEEAKTLRENVTSPQGTTYAALQVLMADDGLAPLIGRAVQAAAARSRELAG